MKFIELCAGAGGMSKGFIKAGLTPVLLIDSDKDCCETLKLNHETHVVKNMDMKNLDLNCYKGKIDLLCGGIPCQSWSIAGKRGGVEDERGHLIYTFRKLLKQCNAKFFLIENVKGMINLNKGEAFKEIIKLFEDEYNVHYKILNANNYGVAQKRERLFIIGIKKNFDLKYTFPQPLEYKPVLRDIMKDIPESIGAEYSDRKKKIFELVPEGGCWVDLPVEIQKDYMGNSFYSGGGKRGIAKRLSMSQPSLTLLCSPQQKQTDRCHPTEIRPLNLKEYARIQSFPDDYKFHGKMNSVYKQIGNAVPVELAFHIGKSIIKMN